MSKQLPVIFLMGPTAVGKTDIAIRLAREYSIDLISVDSTLVYRRLNIGAAKPNPQTLRNAPHHLIDIRDPHESYSAAEFRTDALRLIRQIHAQDRVPLFVGGTGLYFRTLERGIADLPHATGKIRKSLRVLYEQLGPQEMHNRLAAVDPLSAARIHPNDPQRILRALEVNEIAGRPMSEIIAEQVHQPFPYKLHKLIYAPSDRNELHRRIARRFHLMLDEGFINEVLMLRQDPRLNADTPALRAVGYRAVWHYLDGGCSREAMIKDGIVATRRLAKRQYTWFRGESMAEWFDKDPEGLVNRVQQILNHETFQAQIDYT